MTLIWAHARATKVTAPNTMESYAQAIEEGAEGLELDVHLTSDGHLVCCHDGILQLPDGHVLVVGETPLAGLAEVVVGDETTGPTRIPTLQEVYDLLRPTGLELNVEVKNLVHRYPGIAEVVKKSTNHSGMTDRIVISSFHHRLLMELRELAPQLQAAALYADGIIEPWAYFSRLGVSQVHPHFAALDDPGVLEGFLASGMTIRAWTVNDPVVWQKYIEAGVHGIITNDPTGAKALRDGSERGDVLSRLH